MKFKKKPVVVEAVKLPGDVGLMSGKVFNFLKPTDDFEFVSDGLLINTLKGVLKAKAGDWVVRDVKGNLYPYDPDVFAATYDVVDESPDFTNYDQFRPLESLVFEWADTKGIFMNGTPEGQANKTIEEANEILTAIKENDKAEIADGIGDTLVTLIIQARMQGLDILDCLQGAYNTIANRTGRMVNGVFVKDGQ